MVWSRRAQAALLAGLVAAGCAVPAPEPAREYPIAGQVLAVDRDRREVSLKHGDIDGLMPAMTMTFAVRDPALVDQVQPGDLVEGTLEVTISGKPTLLGPGSAAFIASNEEHGWRNSGSTRAHYTVIALGPR